MTPVMRFDRTGTFAVSILIGILIGASVGFGAVAYSDYQDDGLIFNGSISWQTYLGGTLIGGALGGFVAYAIPAISSFMGSSFTFGGGMVMTASGQMMMAAGITITGAQVLGAVGALGALYMFTKTTKLSGKEGATDKPSFVNSNMIDPKLSAQDNARMIMDKVFGPGNWNKATANNAFSKIVKWITRHLWR